MTGADGRRGGRHPVPRRTRLA